MSVCDRVQVGTGQLPEAFEGEERSVAGVGDVLQLVSGRQLLGVVRERQDACLPGPNTLTPCELLELSIWDQFDCPPLMSNSMATGLLYL